MLRDAQRNFIFDSARMCSRGTPPLRPRYFLLNVFQQQGLSPELWKPPTCESTNTWTSTCGSVPRNVIGENRAFWGTHTRHVGRFPYSKRGAWPRASSSTFAGVNCVGRFQRSLKRASNSKASGERSSKTRWPCPRLSATCSRRRRRRGDTHGARAEVAELRAEQGACVAVERVPADVARLIHRVVVKTRAPGVRKRSIGAVESINTVGPLLKPAARSVILSRIYSAGNLRGVDNGEQRISLTRGERLAGDAKDAVPRLRRAADGGLADGKRQQRIGAWPAGGGAQGAPPRSEVSL